MKYDVVNLENNSVGSVELADNVFSTEIKESVLARVIQWQLDKRQRPCQRLHGLQHGLLHLQPLL